jgi:hypothetical protein
MVESNSITPYSSTLVCDIDMNLTFFNPFRSRSSLNKESDSAGPQLKHEVKVLLVDVGLDICDNEAVESFLLANPFFTTGDVDLFEKLDSIDAEEELRSMLHVQPLSRQMIDGMNGARDIISSFTESIWISGAMCRTRNKRYVPTKMQLSFRRGIIQYSSRIKSFSE